MNTVNRIRTFGEVEHKLKASFVDGVKGNSCNALHSLTPDENLQWYVKGLYATVGQIVYWLTLFGKG